MRLLMVEDEKYMAEAVAQVLKRITILLIWRITVKMGWTAGFQAFMTSSFLI